MFLLWNLVLPFALIHYGISSIVAKSVGGIRSGVKYWFKTPKK